jgi:hypothetical protein
MKTKILQTSLLALMAYLMVLLLGACSVHVDDKDKKNEKVDIQTPFANLKIDSSEQAADNGIPVYPGAHLRPADGNDNHSANINLGAAGFGLKVIAAEYETDDSPEKVKAFYEEKMKKFGSTLTCTGHNGHTDVNGGISSGWEHRKDKEKGDDNKLNCSDTSGSGWEIKTGTSDNEHLVSIEPHGSGTRFGTVLVQTHGKQDTL